MEDGSGMGITGSPWSVSDEVGCGSSKRALKKGEAELRIARCTLNCTGGDLVVSSSPETSTTSASDPLNNIFKKEGRELHEIAGEYKWNNQ